MAVQYATVAQFNEVFSLHDIGSNAINTRLIRASTRVNEYLGSVYATPFSSNNATARELTIDITFVGFMLRTRNQEDSKEMRDDVMARIDALVNGMAYMMTDSGEQLSREGIINHIWSTTRDYNNVFDVRPEAEQNIDPDQYDYYKNRDV